MTQKQHQEFISQNLHLLDSYDTRDLFQKLFSASMSKATGLYFTDEGVKGGIKFRGEPDRNGVCTAQCFRIDFEKSMEENIEILKAILGAKGVTLEQAVEVFNLSYSIGCIYLDKDEQGNVLQYKRGRMYTGEKDILQAIEYMTGETPDIYLYNNGKIKIKNLSDKGKERILYLNNTLSKIQNW